MNVYALQRSRSFNPGLPTVRLQSVRQAQESPRHQGWGEFAFVIVTTQTDDLPAAFRLRVALRHLDPGTLPVAAARKAADHVMRRLEDLGRLPAEEVQMNAIVSRGEAACRAEFRKIAACCRAMEQYRAAGA